jgi:hypothetical protein
MLTGIHRPPPTFATKSANNRHDAALFDNFVRQT